jgi:hypothetical protein
VLTYAGRMQVSVRSLRVDHHARSSGGYVGVVLLRCDVIAKGSQSDRPTHAAAAAAPASPSPGAFFIKILLKKKT